MLGWLSCSGILLSLFEAWALVVLAGDYMHDADILFRPSQDHSPCWKGRLMGLHADLAGGRGFRVDGYMHPKP